MDVVVEDEAWGAVHALSALAERVVAATVATARLDVPEDAEMAVVFTDDARVAALNGAHRGKPKPTNVLSFPATPPPPRLPLLGDVVLARETIAAEAADEGRPIANHVAHLIAHGTLHLFGHDHETDAEAGVMEALESAVMRALGLPDPYDGDHDPA